MARLLLLEDDHDIADPLVRALGREGFDVTHVDLGRAALDAIAATPFDLLLVDLSLPDMSGLDVCREVRRRRPAIPIVMLTARSEELDKVVGLDAGADDYVTKPFGLAELMARIRARLRSANQAASQLTEPTAYEARGVRVEPASHRAWHNGEQLSLTPKEFDLLRLLVSEAGRVVVRDRIMREVWDEHWYGPTRTLDVHIGWLRKKLGDDPNHPELISTIRGVGFRFEADDKTSTAAKSVN
ncbi:MAG: response regulator transcription factor [Acidimicrobiia bacterium]